MLKSLKLAVLSKIPVSQACFKVLPFNVLLNSGESKVVVTSLTRIQSGLQQNLFFKIFQ